MADDVNFDSTPMPGWQQEVSRWPWTQVSQDAIYTTYRKQGRCPRCGHSMHSDTKIATILGVKAFDRAGPHPDQVTVRCGCDQLHPNHPTNPDVPGCGQSARVPFRDNIEGS